MDLNYLKRIIAEYKYGQYSLLDNRVKIFVDEPNKTLILEHFYAPGAQSKRGNCTELMNSAYLEIKKMHPEYFIIRAEGNEPQFFNQSFTAHTFLLLPEVDTLKDKGFTQGEEDLKKIIKNDPLVFDPAFKKIMYLSGSGYSIVMGFNKSHKVAYSDYCLLPHGLSVPLGIKSDGNIVFIGADFNSPSRLSIVFPLSPSFVKNCDLNDRTIDFLLEKKRFCRQAKGQKKITSSQL